MAPTTTQRFTFESDPDHGDVLVSVEGMVVTDSDGNAALINPRTPLTSLPEASRSVALFALLDMVSIADPKADVHLDYSERVPFEPTPEENAADAAAVPPVADGGEVAEVPAGDDGTTGAPSEDGDTDAHTPVSAPESVKTDADTEGTIEPTVDELRAALDAKGLTYDGRMGAPRLRAILEAAEAAGV